MKNPYKITGIILSLLFACATAQAATVLYKATLTGAAEFPPNASPGTGSATFTYDTDAHTLRIQASFAGLLAATSAAHIHAPTLVALEGTAGVATQTPSFIGFPLGVMAGSFDQTYDLHLASSYRGSFITDQGSIAGAEATLLSSMANGKAYLNIHTSQFPGGEIRGFISRVPDGSTTGLLCVPVLVALFSLARSRRFSNS
jgi:hypothetical protein